MTFRAFYSIIHWFSVVVLRFDGQAFSLTGRRMTNANEVWLSLVERCVRDAEVVGSNPVASRVVCKIDMGHTPADQAKGLLVKAEHDRGHPLEQQAKGLLFRAEDDIC